MFDYMGIIYQVYILPENAENKPTYDYSVSCKAKTTDDLRWKNKSIKTIKAIRRPLAEGL